MGHRLTDFIDPRKLNITLADVARAVKKPEEKLYHPQKGEWKWAYMFLIVVEGEGGHFGSYRALNIWLEAVFQLLTSCNDWQVLAKLIDATEWDLQHYAYTERNKTQLQEVLQQQKARLEELKSKAIGMIKAWEWAKLWERLIRACQDKESLRVADILFKLQRSQYAEYAEALAWVQRVGRQHWACVLA